MAVEGPSKTDIQLLFKRLRAIPTNKVCFDCNTKNPTWASVTYGVFICIDCSAVHRGLGVHLSFVRSTQLDTNWTWLQLRQMQLGGNASAHIFFRQHNCVSTDAHQKYNSRAAQLYKDKVLQMANQALKTYGTLLIIDSLTHENDENNTNAEERDFFEAHVAIDNTKCDLNPTPFVKKIDTGTVIETAPAPKVNNTFTSDSSSEKSHIIGVRSTGGKRTTFGGKKGGLGAHKVKANFADLERDAALADQIKFSVKEEQPTTPKNVEEQEKSVRLAYQDLSLQQKKQEESLKRTDPKKAEQVERLGMGFNTKSGISHSALSDMTTLDTNLLASKTSKFLLDKTEEDFFECFTNIPSFTSDLKDLRMYLTEATNKKKSSWKDDLYESDSFSSSGTNLKDNNMHNLCEEPKSYASSGTRSVSCSIIKNKPSTLPTSSISGEAQKKFGSAKSISSTQYFSDGRNNDNERLNLGQFEGSTSISSAELFGRPSGDNMPLQTPDFEDVKESVRMGVTKVAGKLSSLASGVMSSIQERYGGH